MTDPTQTPTLMQTFPSEDATNGFMLEAAARRRGYAELRSILSDLKESQATNRHLLDEVTKLRAKPKPVRAACGCLGAAHPRKLREYKGVTYQDGRWWYLSLSYASATSLIQLWHPTFTDADHAAIYALKDDPYEPVETVGDVLHYALNRAYMAGRSDNTMRGWEGIDELTNSIAARLRAAVLAETGGGE